MVYLLTLLQYYNCFWISKIVQISNMPIAFALWFTVQRHQIRIQCFCVYYDTINDWIPPNTTALTKTIDCTGLGGWYFLHTRINADSTTEFARGVGTETDRIFYVLMAWRWIWWMDAKTTKLEWSNNTTNAFFEIYQTKSLHWCITHPKLFHRLKPLANRGTWWLEIVKEMLRNSFGAKIANFWNLSKGEKVTNVNRTSEFFWIRGGF